MYLAKVFKLRFSIVICAILVTCLSREALSQTLTKTDGSVRCRITSLAFVPECNYNEEEGTGTPDLFDLANVDETGGDTIMSKAVQQSLSNDCSDAVTTNFSVAAQNNIVGNVSSNSLFMAEAVGDAYATGDGGPISLYAFSRMTYDAEEPSGGLTGSDVLVFHGTVSVSQGGTAELMSAFANGPGVESLSLATDGVDFQLTGKVIDVLNGTETTYEVTTSGGITASFSMVVSGEFTISTGAGAGRGVVFDEQIAAESDALIAGQLSVFDSSQFPTMNYITVTQ